MSEALLRDRLGAELARRKRAGHPLWYLKVHGGPYQRAGVWDWILCYGGLFAAIETKDPDGGDRPAELDLTPLQRVELRDMTRAKARTLSSRNWAEISQFLSQLAAEAGVDDGL